MDVKRKLRIFRERFNGRQEVYGRKWIMEDKDSGKKRVGYAPVCENIWQNFCHLKLKDGKTCGDCVNKKYNPVSDESVSKHINGDEEHLQFMLLDDGTINFGAIDFDYKEGKEKFGYGWDDVKIVSDIFTSLKIPHGIARSTGSGFHIYIFFDENRCKAYLFRSLIFHVYDRAGFLEQSRQGIRPLSEVFPKQSYIGSDGLGNGIKPPMCENKWPQERNGFVNENNEFIPADQQWEYLDSIERVSETHIEAVLKEHNVRIIEENPTVGKTRDSGSTGSFKRSTNGKWQQPLTGSIEKLLSGCAALRKLRDACLEGKVPNHHDGFALWHLCMSTHDGVDWFYENVPGWGKTEKDRRQLEYSTIKNYSPHTCQALQAQGTCIAGTKCFEKQPPKETVEGRVVIRKDIPKSQWPEPSPIRYAYGHGEDFLLKLIGEAEELKNEKDKDVKEEKLKNLVERAQVFDKEQQKAFKEQLKEMKIGMKSVINKLFSVKQKEKEDKLKDTVKTHDSVFFFSDLIFKKRKPFGFSTIRYDDGKMKETELCSCDIVIKEQRVYLEDSEVIKATYVGEVKSPKVTMSFEISIEDWGDNGKFYSYFDRLAGEAFMVKKQNVDILRLASKAYSAELGIDRSSFIVTQGWYNNTYIMPSVVVDKDGVRPNTEQKVDLSDKQLAKELDFKILSDRETQEVLMHLKTDFLNAWPMKWTSFAISHAFMAATMRHLGIRKKPALFFEGLTGCGKTELMQTVAFFWGSFHRIANLSSTGLGIQNAAHDFKDALLVIDDYKGATRGEKLALERTIQYSYDEGSSRLKMRKDGRADKDKDSRAMLMFTGEEFLSSDSAKVSRCILIDVEKQDFSETKKKYLKCVDMRKTYAGIMPRFIHWFLNQNIEDIKERMLTVEDKIYAMNSGATNSNRIAYNLSRSRINFELFCEFLVYNSVADHAECEEILSKHWDHVIEISQDMASKCTQEQNGLVFVRLLTSMLEAGELSIKDLDGYYNERKVVVGFAKKVGDDTKICLYPDMVFNEVIKYGSNNLHLSGTRYAIHRQLTNLKILEDAADEDGRTTIRVQVNGERKRVWVTTPEKLNLDIEVSEAPKPPLPPPSDDGIF